MHIFIMAQEQHSESPELLLRLWREVPTVAVLTTPVTLTVFGYPLRRHHPSSPLPPSVHPARPPTDK